MNFIIFSIIILFTIISITSISPSAFADNKEVNIETATGNQVRPYCVGTAEGCYIPSKVTVDLGGKVIMTNADVAIHTFTAGTGRSLGETDNEIPSGVFDSGSLNPGQSFEYTADTVGEIPYYCSLHTWMQGMIIVEAVAEPETSMAIVMEPDQMMAEIMNSDGTANEEMTIDFTLTDLEGNGVEHITYNIKATQGSEILLDEEGHMHKGTITNNHVASALPVDASDAMPVLITIASVGFGHDEQYVDFAGEIATKQVIPEFGTITMMVLTVAIISIVAITAKSRLNIMPRI